MMFLCRAVVSAIAAFALPSILFADAKKPTFDDDVAPILKQHCNGCHGNDKQKGDLNLAGFSKLMEGGSSGAVTTRR